MFWPRSNLFKFCKSVRFAQLHDVPEQRAEARYAIDPPAWFARLREEDIRGFLVHHLSYNPKDFPDRMTAGFAGGGGRWLLEAAGESGSGVWEAKWEVGDKDDPDQNIWKVTYGRIAENGPHLVRADRAPDAVAADLRPALADIAAFAARMAQSDFARCFERGLATLGSAAPLKGTFYEEFNATLLAFPARRLLGACIHAHVFGAMGSWNDVYFEGEDQALYETLSQRLFNLVNEAITSAANSTFA